jgi:hypothetical protein
VRGVANQVSGLEALPAATRLCIQTKPEFTWSETVQIPGWKPGCHSLLVASDAIPLAPASLPNLVSLLPGSYGRLVSGI